MGCFYLSTGYLLKGAKSGVSGPVGAGEGGWPGGQGGQKEAVLVVISLRRCALKVATSSLQEANAAP